MSIQKKSLLSSLNTTKKANVAKSEVGAKPTSVKSKRGFVRNTKSLKRSVTSLKSLDMALKLK